MPMIESTIADKTTAAGRHTYLATQQLGESALEAGLGGALRNSRFQTFSIINHVDKLTPAKEKGRYICPVCDCYNSTVSKNGSERCRDGCECWEIRDRKAFEMLQESSTEEGSV